MRFSLGRIGFAVIAGAPGSTITPSLGTYGWPLLLGSALGLCLSAMRRRTWPVTMMAAAVLIEAGGLYAFATAHHNVPYMAQKMAFLFLFVQGTAVALALDRLWTIGLSAIGALDRPAPGGGSLPWAGAAGIAVLAIWPLLVAPRTPRLRSDPAITAPLEHAGLWAAAHLPHECVDYLVPNYASAYWLHLAVLGNPRAGERTGDSRTYDLEPSLVRWLTPGGVPYAIVDRRSVPRGIAEELDVVASFDDVAIARRRSDVGVPGGAANPLICGIIGGPVAELISIVVPAYNEGATILTVLERLLQIDLPCAREIIVVNDASTDNTRAALDAFAATRPLLTVVHVAENRGKGHAVRLGLARSRGTVTAIQDADLELDPAQLAALVAPVLSGSAVAVYGSRFLAASGHVPRVTRLGNLALTWLTNRLYGQRLTDMETCYKIIRGDVARGAAAARRPVRHRAGDHGIAAAQRSPHRRAAGRLHAAIPGRRQEDPLARRPARDPGAGEIPRDQRGAAATRRRSRPDDDGGFRLEN